MCSIVLGKVAPDKIRAYKIQHHDEGLVTYRHKYRSEGYRVFGVTETMKNRASFISQDPINVSGTARAIVPKNDLVRYFSNCNSGYSNQNVLAICEEFSDENIIHAARDSNFVDKVEIKMDDNVEILSV